MLHVHTDSDDVRTVIHWTQTAAAAATAYPEARVSGGPATQKRTRTTRSEAGVAVPGSRNFTKKHRAAILLAEDELTDEAIAAEVGVSRRTLATWKLDPEFMAQVGDHQGAIIAQALKLPIAKKHERVRQLNDLNERYQRIISDRAARYAAEAEDTPENAVRGVFGDETPSEAATGMLVRQPKIAASGKTVVEWAFDRSLDSAIKETHKQAAQELGQWEESLSITHGGTLQQEYVIVENVPWGDASDGDE